MLSERMFFEAVTQTTRSNMHLSKMIRQVSMYELNYQKKQMCLIMSNCYTQAQKKQIVIILCEQITEKIQITNEKKKCMNSHPISCPHWHEKSHICFRLI